MTKLKTIEDPFKRIHRETLTRKEQLSIPRNVVLETFPVDSVEVSTYIDFEKGKKLPANGKSVAFLYQKLLSVNSLLTDAGIKTEIVYPLIEFTKITKVALLMWDGSEFIDPQGCYAYCTHEGVIVLIINREVTYGLSLIEIGGIHSYERYDTNINVSIRDRYKDSILTFTNGKIEYLPITGTPGNFYVPIRSQDKYTIMIISDNVRVYSILPQINSKYNYVNFPADVGFTKLSNIYWWTNDKADFNQPLKYTEMYDGILVDNTFTTTLELNGTSNEIIMKDKDNNYPAMDEMTINFRMKFKSFRTIQTIAQRGTEDGAVNGWIIRLQTGRITFNCNRYNKDTLIQSNPLLIDTWYNITITGTSSSLKIYINAIEEPESLRFSSVPLVPENKFLRFGKSSTGNTFIAGEIEYFQIFNRVLSISEIRNIQDGGTVNNGLRNLWRFNAGTGNIVKDSVPSGIDGVISGTAIWHNNTVQQSPRRTIAFFKRYETVKSYSDLRQYYGKYFNYMQQFISDTLPPIIQNYQQFSPLIGPNTPTEEYRTSLIRASQDFPNFIKNYLEEIYSLATHSYPIISVRPKYERDTTNYDPASDQFVTKDIPRFVKSENWKENGLIMEPVWQNIISDPQFKNGISTDAKSDDQFTIPLSSTIDNKYEIVGDMLHHIAINRNKGQIRLNTPNIVISSSRPVSISFETKYLRKTFERKLFISGSALTNELDVTAYAHTKMIAQGWEMTEINLPSSLFTGTGSRLQLSIRGDIDGYEDVDYYIKHFRASESKRSYIYSSDLKGQEILRIPTESLFTKNAGTVELWLTLKGLNYNDNNIIMNNYIMGQFGVEVSPLGKLLCYASPSQMIEIPNFIMKENIPYHITLSWNNTTVSIYVNGELKGSINSEVTIVREFFIGGNAAAQSANAILHDLKISNVQLSSQDILTDAQSNERMIFTSGTTSLKLEFKNDIRSPNTLYHPTSITTSHQLSERLLFANGLNISPAKTTYDLSTRKYTSFFRENDIDQMITEIIELDTDVRSQPYYEKITSVNDELSFGPSSMIGPKTPFNLYVIGPPSGERSTGELTIVDPSKYTSVIDTDLIKVTLKDLTLVGQTFYLCTSHYNQIVSRPHSNAGLIGKLPSWMSFIPKEQFFIFLNGQFLSRERFYLFNPIDYKVTKGDMVIATDLDTDTINGETFNAWVSSDYEMIEYHTTVINGQKVVELLDKSLPFSKKYFLIFINGKLINPNTITEIGNHSFSLTSDSIQEVCILRKVFDIPYLKYFENVTDKWDEYLNTLSLDEMQSILGSFGTITDQKDDRRSVYLEQRHLFEILYWYALRNHRNLTDDDYNIIKEELPGVLLDDGRIPISTMRKGLYPRYPL